jgi:large subunit ribosomal protein L15
MVRLNELPRESGRKKRRRPGRGIGSGDGKTAGRGHKGQKARSGISIKGFEGGQMPLHRRLPKRGFTGVSKKNKPAKFDFDTINRLIENKKVNPSEEVSDWTLFELGVIRRPVGKLLCNGSPPPGLAVVTWDVSSKAKAEIERAGGSVRCWRGMEPPSRPRILSEKGEPGMMLIGSLSSEDDGALQLVVRLEGSDPQEADPDILREYEFILDPVDAEFSPRSFTLGDMVSKNSEHRHVAEFKAEGRRTGNHPAVSIITLFRRNYLGMQQLVPAEAGTFSSTARL